MVMGTSQLDRALALASLGMFVFPCHPASFGRKYKSPMIAGGFESASTDPVQIRKWWEAWPDALVGVAAGASGLVILDLDVKLPDVSGSAELDRRDLDYASPLTYTTPSGGIHAYFRDRGEGLGPAVKFGGIPGVDVRAGRSYAIFHGEPPSSLDDLPGVPGWLALGTTKPAKPATASGGAAGRPTAEIATAILAWTTTTPYGEAALNAELRRLATTSEGSRNQVLFEVALKLSSLIAGGQLDGRTTVEKVAGAALAAGLDLAEITTTLFRPGGPLDTGIASPRRAPEAPSGLAALAAPAVPSEDLKIANILDWADLYASGPVVEDWLVPNFICAARGHSLYSDAGVGKSLLMRDVAACLASGKSALGLPARDPMRVLYLDYENNPHSDIKSSLMDMGFEADELGLLFLASFPEFGPFDTESGAEKLLRVVDTLNPELIVIDTLSRVIEGDENSNDTWNTFYKLTGKEFKKREIAYVRLDHEGKNATNGARGGSAKRGDVDLIWRYIKKGSEFHLSNEKSRGLSPDNLVVIERRLDPLKHVMVSVSDSTFNWPTMMALAARHDTLCDLLAQHRDLTGSLPSQRAAWDKFRGDVERLDATRNDLIGSLKWLQELERLDRASETEESD